MQSKWYLRCSRWFVLGLTLLMAELLSCTGREPLRPMFIHRAVMQGDLGAVRRLLGANPVLVNARDGHGRTPLCLAAAVGEVGIGETLLNAGADPSAGDDRGQTPLHYVLDGVRSVKAAQLLLQHSAAVDARDETKRTPLYYAVSKGCPEIVEALLKAGADPNAQDNEGNTPLHEAARVSGPELVDLLLSRGADLGLKNAAGKRPVHVALYGSPEIARMLGDKADAADVFAASGLGMVHAVRGLLEQEPGLVDRTLGLRRASALHFAGACGQQETAEVLLEKGADPNHRNEWGKTPLHLAAFFGQNTLVLLLLERGADIDAKDKQGRTALRDTLDLHLWHDRSETIQLLVDRGAALDMFTASALDDTETLAALLRGHPGIVNECSPPIERTPLHEAAQFGSTQAAKVLVQQGAEVDARRIDGQTPLHEAAMWGQAEVARLLVTQGADPTVKAERTGYRPLHLAAQKGHTAVAELLLDAGADIDAMDWQGHTPLYWAAATGRSKLVQLLLKRGADTKAQDIFGATPLHAAAAAGNVDVLEILFSAGADIGAEDKWGRTPLRVAIQNRKRGAEQVIREHRAQE